MKDKNIELSVGELETLCNLYIECKLSVLEETELYYVLLKTDKDSALINETKVIMGIEQKIAYSKPTIVSKKPFYKRFAFYGAAVCITIIVVFAALISKFGELTSPKTRILSQITTDTISVKPFNELKEQAEKDSVVKIKNEGQSLAHVGKTTKIISTTPPRSEFQTNPEKSVADSTIQDGYIEITNEKEANLLMEEINEKLVALLERGINARQNVPDLNELLDNVFKKI
ncbi:MAG: hypothetical protein J1F20_05320 [Muribaculaceae bacterium]|nr:hypothetical protein [Muribaculaceae bacterium]